MADNILFKTVLSKAMAHCSRREYCIDDIRRKMLVWGVSNKDAENIISILVRENFINEVRYANAFVRDKFIYNKWGKIKIEVHLKVKKIPQDIIQQALEVIDNEAYMKLIKVLISEQRKKVKAKNQYDLKAKLLRYGLSKGFESSILYDLLNDIED